MTLALNFRIIAGFLLLAIGDALLGTGAMG